jgi:hypothetical protein
MIRVSYQRAGATEHRSPLAALPSADVIMALRVFPDHEGREWQVWNVEPSNGDRGVRKDLSGGWLCFELVGGGERCRLPLTEVQGRWEKLPDARLEALRRLATTERPSHRARRLSGEQAAIEDGEVGESARPT